MTSVPVRFVIRVALVAGLSAGFPRAALAATVTVPGDYSTIQAAINAVPSGTTINLQAGTYTEKLTVTGSKSLTVRAIGGAVIVNAAGKNGAAVTVSNAQGQIVFEGLTFRNGARQQGGGFFIDRSSPSFVNCIFEDNASTADGGGGALFTSNATFTGCTIRNNSAAHFGGGVYIALGSRPVFTNCDIVTNHSGTGGAGGGGNNGAGGGIFSNDSSPTFRGSRINVNTSMFASGGIHHQGTYGSPYGTATLVLEDTDIADNVSSQFPGEPNPAEGGGVHVEDNAIATLNRVRILRNRAGTGGGLNAYRGRYDITDSLIDANQATAGFGGGIGASNNFSTAQTPATIVNLTRSLVRNNTAPMGGGIGMVGYSSQKATLSLSGSVVSGNQSQSQGGGILANVTNVTTANSLIINNNVSGGTNPYGGGLLITTTSAATINTTTIAHNSAGVYGGGIFVNDASSLNMSGSQIYDNTAPGFGGGGLFVGGSATLSGTIASSIIADNSGYQIVEHACPATKLTYNNNTITPKTGNSDLYVNGCTGQNAGNIAQFEALGNTSGNSSGVPRFVKFLAVPGNGTSSTLAWSVGRATSVTIAGVITSNDPTGTVDVAPSSSTTYTLTATANSGNYGPVTAGFTSVQPLVEIVDGDLDGDSRADITVFRPSTGTWYIRYTATPTSAALVWGGGADKPVRGNFDGDGKGDVAVFRPSTGTWYIRYSATPTSAALVWGGGSDVPVPGDYDGDGTTDIAVFRPSTGTWYIRYSGTPTSAALVWGGGADVAVPGDYDGDRKTDLAVFRPSTGTWYIRYTGTGASAAPVWGGGSDLPVPVDFDGDGKTEIAVFRPSTGTWYIRYTATPTSAALVWGGGGDVPVSGDYDGDGKAEIAVFRPSTGTWYIRYTATPTTTALVWGGAGDIPLLKRP